MKSCRNCIWCGGKYKDKSLGYYCNKKEQKVKKSCEYYKELKEEETKNTTYTIQNVLEEKGEIRMYDNLLLYLETILRPPIKVNAKAIKSLIPLMLNNRDIFLDLIYDKENNKLWQRPNGEFFIKGVNNE